MLFTRLQSFLFLQCAEHFIMLLRFFLSVSRISKQAIVHNLSNKNAGINDLLLVMATSTQVNIVCLSSKYCTFVENFRINTNRLSGVPDKTFYCLRNALFLRRTCYTA